MLYYVGKEMTSRSYKKYLQFIISKMRKSDCPIVQRYTTYNDWSFKDITKDRWKDHQTVIYISILVHHTY